MVDFDATPLASVLAEIGRLAGVPVHADWEALKAAGVTGAEPITLRTTPIRADRALRLALAVAAHHAAGPPLAYRVVHDEVQVSTRYAFAGTRTMQVYDIHDLLEPSPAVDDVPLVRLAPAGTDASGDAIAARRSEGVRVAQTVAIAKLIETAVGESEDWESHGGSVEPLGAIEGHIIVHTTPENHAQIVQLLDMLRAQRIHVALETRSLEVDAAAVADLRRGATRELSAEAPPGTLVFLPNESSINRLLSPPDGARGSRWSAEPRAHLLSGGRELLASARGRYQPLTLPSESSGESVKAEVFDGGVVRASAAASADRREVTLSVKARSGKIERADDPSGIAEAETRVVASVPDRGIVALAAPIRRRSLVDIRQTGEAAAPVWGEGPESVDPPQRYLLVLLKPTVVQIEKDEENLFPGLEEP